MKQFLILLFLVFSISAHAQFPYTPVFKGQEGDDLLASMVSEFKPATVLSYSDARNEMYSSIDNQNGNVIGIYTEHSITLPSNEPDPIQFLLMNNSVDGINCEHTYPQSKGAGSGNARSDMHHLHPARAQVNSGRGSKPYGQIPDSDTDTWYYLNQSQSSIPNASVIDDYSENDILGFEPRESVKGNIARGIMYFYTMYEAEANAADPNFFWIQIQTLCDWHFADPVDQAEWNRTMMIGAIQGDNPNPYVLDCSVAARTYCDQISAACEELVPAKEIEILNPFNFYPNPSSDIVNIDLAEITPSASVRIINLYGKVIFQEDYSQIKKLSIHHQFPAGNYICQISLNGDNYQKLFVVVK